MSEHTSTPLPEDRGDEDEGTFVGGEFGHGDNTEDGHLTTAQQEGAAREEEAYLADPDQSAAATLESGFGSDVEGTTTEPPPGERNDPV